MVGEMQVEVSGQQPTVIIGTENIVTCQEKVIT